MTERIEELEQAVVELGRVVSILLEANGVLTEEVTRSHARLDKASAAVKTLREATKAQPVQAPRTQQGKTRPVQHRTTRNTGAPKLDGERKMACSVPGDKHEEPTFHTAAELAECWKQHHAAKA